LLTQHAFLRMPPSFCPLSFYHDYLGINPDTLDIVVQRWALLPSTKFCMICPLSSSTPRKTTTGKQIGCFVQTMLPVYPLKRPIGHVAVDPNNPREETSWPSKCLRKYGSSKALSKRKCGHWDIDSRGLRRCCVPIFVNNRFINVSTYVETSHQSGWYHNSYLIINHCEGRRVYHSLPR